MCFFFFFNDTATTEFYTYLHALSLRDALPISAPGAGVRTMVAAWHSFARQGDHRLVEPLRSVQSRGSSLPRYLRWFRIPAAQRFTEHDRLTGQIGRAHV